MEQDNLSISWNFLPWKKFQRKSFQLQRKIYQSKHSGDAKSFKRLQKLFIKSKSIYYLSVKEITNYYSSKGIFLSQRMKLKLVDHLYKNLSTWKFFRSSTKKRLTFFSLDYLKMELSAFIWKRIFNSSQGHKFITVTKKSTQILSKFLNIENINTSSKLRVTEFLTTVNGKFFKAIQSQSLLFALKMSSKFNVSIFKSLSSLLNNFCLCRRFLTFTRYLHFLISDITLHCRKSFSLFRVAGEEYWVPRLSEGTYIV